MIRVFYAAMRTGSILPNGILPNCILPNRKSHKWADLEKGMPETTPGETHPTCYIAPGAVLIGEVHLGKGCSVWPNAVIRADLNTISMGNDCNIQDCVVIHCTPENGVEIGAGCSLGHGCIVHGATVGDNCIVGMNASVLDGAVIGDNTIIGANALVTPGMKIPSDSLVVGVPGKVVKQGDGMGEACRLNADSYRRLRDEYLEGQHHIHHIHRQVSD